MLLMYYDYIFMMRSNQLDYSKQYEQFLQPNNFLNFLISMFQTQYLNL